MHRVCNAVTSGHAVCDFRSDRFNVAYRDQARMPRVAPSVAAIGLDQFYSDNLWRNTDPLYDEAYSF